MDDDTIEIDQLEPGHVVLAIPARHLIVIGRTLEEARAWARSALASGTLDHGPARREQAGTAAGSEDDSPTASAA